MGNPYDKLLLDKINEIAKLANIVLKKEVYDAVMGTQLEIRSVFRLLEIIGADAVGMSTVPEVIVANHLHLPVLAVSVITDECDPENLQPVDIRGIIEIAGKAEPQMIRLFKGLIHEL